MSLDQKKVKDILESFKDFASAMDQEYGIKISVGTLRWTPSDFTVKITGAVNDTGNENISGRELEFMNNYKSTYYRLTGTNMLGKKCFTNGRTYELIGAKPRVGRQPLILREIGSGKLVSSTTDFFLNNLIKE